jgi:SulP family sulfate permease
VLPGALFAQERFPGRALLATGRLPGPIVALVTLSVLARTLDMPVETIGSRFGGIPTALPAFAWPAIDWESAQQLFIPTLTIALLGAVESLLCARVADNLAGDHDSAGSGSHSGGSGAAPFARHDPNQELMAQGVANIVAPFFGGIPATGTIARTVTNVRAGATSPVAGMVHALALLAIVLVAGPLAAHVPLAVLAGILLFVAWNMGEWHEFARLRHYGVPYATLLVGTFALTVIFDLTVAVEVALALACVFFIYRMSTLFRIEPVELLPGAGISAPAGAEAPGAVQAMRLYGALFFGAVGKVEGVAERLPPAARALVLDFERLIFIDSSGFDALQQLRRTLTGRGVRLIVCGAGEQPQRLLHRSGFADLLGAENVAADLAEALACLRGVSDATGAAPAPSPSSSPPAPAPVAAPAPASASARAPDTLDGTHLPAPSPVAPEPPAS